MHVVKCAHFVREACGPCGTYLVLLLNIYFADDIGSQVHGHIIEGLFQGRITLSDGEIFNVERKEKYRSNKVLTNHKTAHSVIYRDKDIRDPNDIMRYCIVEEFILARV